MTSRVLIIGQAPGRAAHESGVPWDDRSGDRLRAWLGLSREQFYDASLVALMPMGFCFPGTSKAGDMPPRKECAPAWHAKFLAAYKALGLTLLIGKYAFDQYLGGRYAGLTEAVAGHEALLPGSAALPHPSPRNNIWLKKHPWFEDVALPRVRERVLELVRG